MAIDEAYEDCKDSGAHCPDNAAQVFSDGPLPAEPTPVPKIKRWTTQCVGANCVRTYEDGRQQSFTACVNPSTGFAFDNIGGSCAGKDLSGHVFRVQ
jgi:hypothetical protein